VQLKGAGTFLRSPEWVPLHLFISFIPPNLPDRCHTGFPLEAAKIHPYILKRDHIMRTATIISLSLFVLLLGGCKDKHEKVADERQEARQEIGKAEANVVKQQVEASREINKAAAKGDVAAVEDEKVEATEEIAAAKKKVGDEKVEATQEITKAEKAAGETTGTYKHE
jgi:hypothetical protein